MNYYGLQSEVKRGKRSFKIKETINSYQISKEQNKEFIAPDFNVTFDEKIEEAEIILISAIGATGKSTLAKELSYHLQLPILDLYKHEAVGSNSLTGVLTKEYNIEDLSPLLDAMQKGEYLIIIDGIDEGRSKTNQASFNAFLNDILGKCSNTGKPKFVLLGRTQVLDDCWLYFNENGIKTCMLEIKPFNLDQAEKYIDKKTKEHISTSNLSQYNKAKLIIIENLKSFFEGDFHSLNSFLGYAPVLDSITTLLASEKNFFKLIQDFEEKNNKDLDLIIEILDNLIIREKDEKVIPNIISSKFNDIKDDESKNIRENAFTVKEQCARLLAHVINEEYFLRITEDETINTRYNKEIISWIPEHPFLQGNKIKNIIFESYILAHLIDCEESNIKNLVQRFYLLKTTNQYLIFLLQKILGNKKVQSDNVGLVFESAYALELPSNRIKITVDGSSFHDHLSELKSLDNEIEITIENENQDHNIVLKSDINSQSKMPIKNFISNCYINVPCNIIFFASEEFRCVAPVNVSCKKIIFDSKSLLSIKSKDDSDESIYIECNEVDSKLQSIDNKTETKIYYYKKTFYSHPLTLIAENIDIPEIDENLKSKYNRLRRIIQEFRSHSKGSLAKLKDKIEHQRVLKDVYGEKLLNKLVKTGVIYQEGKMYHINPEELDNNLGLDWIGIRKYEINEKTKKFLKTI